MSAKKELPYAEKVFTESTKKIRESWPKVVVNIVLAFIIWVFGTAIFIPLGLGLTVLGIALSRIILGITLFAVFVLLVMVLKEVRDMADGAAGIAVYQWGRGRRMSPEELGHYRTAFRGIFYVLVVALIFLVFTPMMDWISPAFRGILLVLVFLWAVYTLYSAGLAIKAEITRAAESSVKTLEERLRRE